jgi:hypothetical protein
MAGQVTNAKTPGQVRQAAAGAKNLALWREPHGRAGEPSMALSV